MESRTGRKTGKSRGGLRIWQVTGNAEELAAEVLRLLVLYPHDDETLGALGIEKEDMAAHLCATLPAPGGVLLTADDGLRLKGLLYIEPILDQSAAFDMHVWKIKLLVVAPDAPPDAIDALLGYATMFTGAPMDFMYASIPAADGQAIGGLQRAGFDVVSGEAVAVNKDPRTNLARSNLLRVTDLVYERLQEATTIVSGCEHSNRLLYDPAFDARRTRKLVRQRLLRRLSDGDSRCLMALEGSGKLSGLAVCGNDSGLQAVAGCRLASLDNLCLNGTARPAIVERFLVHSAVGELADRGFEGVVSRILMNGSPSCARLESMQKTGFEITQSNLILHKWFRKAGRKSA